MRRSQTEAKPHSRRRSLFQNSVLSNLFSNQRSPPPPPPPQQQQQQPQHHRSRSLDSSAGMDGHSPGKLASILSKAKRHGLRRLPTLPDLHQIDEKHGVLSPPPPLPVSRQPLYLLTTGEEEADRIQLKNDLCKLAFEGEFSSPIDFHKIADGRVLDIGCGPGSWCIDLARQYPRLHVIGVDNIDMFPDPYTIPSNCRLLSYNVLDGMCNTQFEQESFDCIHIRFMCLALTQEQYTQVINDCWQLLKPGGYLEMMEMDMMVYSPGPTTEELNLQVVEAARSRGLKPRLARQLASLIPADAVRRLEKYRSLPIGFWGGRLGILAREDLSHVLTNSRAAVNGHSVARGRPPEDPRKFQRQLTMALRELEQHHSYSNFHIIVAQKPSPSDF